MAATFSSSAAGGGTSGTVNRTASITPVESNDLLIVFCHASGNTNAAPTCSDDNTGGSYTLIGTALNGSSANTLSVFVRNNLVPNTTATTVTVATGSNTAAEIVIVSYKGMLRAGPDAIRGKGSQANQASGGTPAPALNISALTGNPTISAVANSTVAGSVAVPNASWTERQDVAQSTPTTGLEVNTRDSGFTGTTITFGGTSGTAFSSFAIELDSSAPPPMSFEDYSDILNRAQQPSTDRTGDAQNIFQPPPAAPDLSDVRYPDIIFSAKPHGSRAHHVEAIQPGAGVRFPGQSLRDVLGSRAVRFYNAYAPGSWHDDIANNHATNANGAQQPTETDTPVGGSFVNFDGDATGANADFLTGPAIGTLATYNSTGFYLQCFVVKADALGPDNEDIITRVSATGDERVLVLVGGQIGSSYGAQSNASILNDGHYHRVILLGDAAANNVKMYVDGVLQTTEGNAATSPLGSQWKGAVQEIGARNNSTGDYRLRGALALMAFAFDASSFSSDIATIDAALSEYAFGLSGGSTPDFFRSSFADSVRSPVALSACRADIDLVITVTPPPPAPVQFPVEFPDSVVRAGLPVDARQEVSLAPYQQPPPPTAPDLVSWSFPDRLSRSLIDASDQLSEVLPAQPERTSPLASTDFPYLVRRAALVAPSQWSTSPAPERTSPLASVAYPDHIERPHFGASRQLASTEISPQPERTIAPAFVSFADWVARVDARSRVLFAAPVAPPAAAPPAVPTFAAAYVVDAVARRLFGAGQQQDSVLPERVTTTTLASWEPPEYPDRIPAAARTSELGTTSTRSMAPVAAASPTPAAFAVYPDVAWRARLVPIGHVAVAAPATPAAAAVYPDTVRQAPRSPWTSWVLPPERLPFFASWSPDTLIGRSRTHGESFVRPPTQSTPVVMAPVSYPDRIDRPFYGSIVDGFEPWPTVHVPDVSQLPNVELRVTGLSPLSFATIKRNEGVSLESSAPPKLSAQVKDNDATATEPLPSRFVPKR